MSLKKRIFRSNMLILFLALFLLFMIAVVMFAVFEDDVWEDISKMGHLLRNANGVMFLAFVVAAGMVTVLILILSGIFTNKMIRRITDPLELLVQGTERVQNGDLTQEIVYKGDGEFQKVCAIFNAMQKKMLEDQQQRIQTEKARIDMVTGISHDLRTPLTSIRGYIKGVLDGIANTPEKRQLYLETAYDATGEMNTLLQKLFEFSKMESGMMPMHLVTADLSELAGVYVAQKEAVLQAEQVVLHLKRDSEAFPEVRMDVEQMQRVFDNLLENSMKYAGTTPVEICIHIYETEKSVLMDWKDNGAGVPEEKLGDIFKRFYRCDASRSQKGSGVGLYVVKYIMEQQGGEIAAENQDGLLLHMSFPKGDIDENIDRGR